MQQRINRKGFVLIETIIVMTVISLALILLYGTYVKILQNSSTVSYYEQTEDIYTAYYVFTISNKLDYPNEKRIEVQYPEANENQQETQTQDETLKKNLDPVLSNLGIEKIYFFNKNDAENLTKNLISYDGTTINYLRSIENKVITSECKESDTTPCLTVVKIKRNNKYYFAKYENY